MKQELLYLRQRLNQEVAMAAAAANPHAKRVHDALADAFYDRIMELRSEASGALLELLDE